MRKYLKSLIFLFFLTPLISQAGLPGRTMTDQPIGTMTPCEARCEKIYLGSSKGVAMCKQQQCKNPSGGKTFVPLIKRN